MAPQDLVKFSQLYVAGGHWNGQQIVSASCVNDSVTTHAPTPGARFTFSQNYGHQWPITNENAHHGNAAAMFGGQLVEVVPDLRLLVMTATEVNGSTVHLKLIRGLVALVLVPAVGGQQRQQIENADDKRQARSQPATSVAQHEKIMSAPAQQIPVKVSNTMARRSIQPFTAPAASTINIHRSSQSIGTPQPSRSTFQPRPPPAAQCCWQRCFRPGPMSIVAVLHELRRASQSPGPVDRADALTRAHRPRNLAHIVLAASLDNPTGTSAN